MNAIGSYDPNLFRVMLLISTGTNEGHAVMYWGPDTDSTYMITDPQNQNIPYPVNKGDVIDAYKVLHNH